MSIAFDEFVVDFDQRRLFAEDREIRLTPKAFDLLRLLIESRPRALGKDEIFTHLWRGTFVTENNLPTLIAELRSALGDDARAPRIIRTAYAFGYAFVADAAEWTAPAAGMALAQWTLILAEREIQLHDGSHVLGRTGPGIVALDSPTVSRHHARLTITGDRATIEDLGSKNGTWVDQQSVTGPSSVRDGGEIRLGSLTLILRSAPLPASTVSIDRPDVTKRHSGA
jgi:DNA-binding winged helix-turn-helix (wHTH) protein